MAYPVAGRTAKETEAALMHFMGPRQRMEYFYSDRAPELIKAAGDIGIAHGLGTPGTPEPNGIIERANQRVVEGTNTIVERSGFAAHWWPPCR